MELLENEIKDLVFLSEPNVNLHIIQRANSQLRLHVVSFVSAENEIVVEQQGAGCLTEISHLVYLKNKDCVRTHTCVRHMVGGGVSHQQLRYVLADEAQGEFFGELYIAPDAQQTEATQSNRNLLLSPRALMRTRPQLEIYADDVKASHGASTGQLDESALFYMQQRCLSEKQARAMLVGSFMKEVVSSVRDDAQRENIFQLIDKSLI